MQQIKSLAISTHKKAIPKSFYSCLKHRVMFLIIRKVFSEMNLSRMIFLSIISSYCACMHSLIRSLMSLTRAHIMSRRRCYSIYLLIISVGHWHQRRGQLVWKEKRERRRKFLSNYIKRKSHKHVNYNTIDSRKETNVFIVFASILIACTNF